MPDLANLHVAVHPAIADRLVRLRDRSTSTTVFRRLVEELGIFLAYEATRELPAREQRLESPIVVPILRAGLGLLPGFLDVIDDAVVAHLGFYRDPNSLEAIPYYANLPPELSSRQIFVLDPMLATGNSGIAALNALSERGATNITFICAIAAPQGVRAIAAAHPGVRIVAAALDEGLNDHGYIVPGLGDAGDRMYGSLSSVPTSVRVRA